MNQTCEVSGCKVELLHRAGEVSSGRQPGIFPSLFHLIQRRIINKAHWSAEAQMNILKVYIQYSNLILFIYCDLILCFTLLLFVFFLAGVFLQPLITWTLNIINLYKKNRKVHFCFAGAQNIIYSQFTV